MKKFVLILIGLIFAIVELSITNRFSIFGTHINLLMIYTVLLATNIDSANNYLAIGIVGFVFDLLGELIFGINLAWVLLVTWLVRLSMDKLYEEKKWSIAMIFLLAMLLTCVYEYAINQVFYVPKRIDVLTSVLPAYIILNTILGLTLSTIIRPFFRHIMKNWW